MAHDNWTSHDQQCCLVENGRRCGRVAGNASYSKRIQKTVAQRKLKLHMDNSVSNNILRSNLIGNVEILKFQERVEQVFHFIYRPAISIFVTTTKNLSKAYVQKENGRIRKMIREKQILNTQK